MAMPAIVIHEPSTTPSTVARDADAEGERAQAGRREHADDAGLVGGVGVGAVLRSRVARGGGASPRSTRRRARRARSPSAAARRRPGRRRRASRARRSRRSTRVTPAHSERSRCLTASSAASSAGRCSGTSASWSDGRHAARADGADVGVVDPAQVEHRALGADRRQPREVVLRRRRRRRPLQRVGVPRVGARRRRAAQRAHDVDEERHERQRPARTMPIDEIRFSVSKSSTSRVVGDPARHAVAAEEVHDEERHVEPDDQQPEVDRAEPLGRASARSPSGHQK